VEGANLTQIIFKFICICTGMNLAIFPFLEWKDVIIIRKIINEIVIRKSLQLWLGCRLFQLLPF
jgi:hypothetical protein